MRLTTSYGEALAQTIKRISPLPSRTLSAVQDGTRRRMDNVLAITDTDAEGRKCLILWHNLHKTNNSTLSHWFTQHQENFEKPDIIYTNADHTLNALKRKNETWIAKTIEPIYSEN